MIVHSAGEAAIYNNVYFPACEALPAIDALKAESLVLFGQKRRQRSKATSPLSNVIGARSNISLLNVPQVIDVLPLGQRHHSG